jgi:hypothetical protein
MEANVAFMRAFNKQLKDEGVYVATEELGWPDQAKLVRADQGGVIDSARPRRSKLGERRQGWFDGS